MQGISKRKKHIVVYASLLFFLLIAYLPVSSFLFALKNDALTANFPNKYFFSASLQARFFPIWNPYLNFGLPLYADPGFAFWNPVTWLFGWLGYSVPMLSAELLMYIWIAGIATFELGIWMGHTIRTSFCMGIMYMCCGLFVGNLQQINFLTSAAFLPLVVKTYLDLQKSFSVQKLFYCLISLYLFASAGHPAIPLACIYFLIIIQLGLTVFEKGYGEMAKNILTALKTNLILICCFSILAAPLFYSYYEIYPRFTRGGPAGQSFLLNTGFDIRSYISFIFPFSNTGHDAFFSNDALMRNGYFSLAGFICFLMILVKNKNVYQKVFLLAGGCMLVLSLGGRVKETLYEWLPLLTYIRINGEFRIFGLLSFIIAGSYTLNNLMSGEHLKEFKKISCAIAVLCFILIIGYFYFGSPNLVFFNHQNKSGGFFRQIKSWLDGLTFYDRLFINALFIIFLIVCCYFISRKMKASSWLPVFIATDLIVCSWLNLPVTGVQQKGPFEIQKYFAKIPSGIPVPRLEPIEKNRYTGEDIRKIIGDWSYYSKQPGSPDFGNYPTRLNYTAGYFNSFLPDSINKKSILFLQNPSHLVTMAVTEFSPSEISVHVELSKKDSLTLLQNDYFRWKATVNGKSVEIRRSAIAFMQIPLENGVSEVKFVYDSSVISMVALLCLLCWILFSGYVFFTIRRQKRTTPGRII